MKTIQDQLAEKTYRELSAPNKPSSRSRVWQATEGYRFLVQWTNLVLLEILIRLFTKTLPKSEYRLKAQLDDAVRSSVANMEEGWKRANTSEYLQFLGYCQGSLEEVKGDIRRCLQNGFLRSIIGSNLASLGIDLKEWKTWCGSPLNSSKILYFPLKGSKGLLKDLKENNLTFEIFMELINKTDYLLRTLVSSLERKLSSDQKHYQVEKARIRNAGKTPS